jgi:hypothetical protein
MAMIFNFIAWVCSFAALLAVTYLVYSLIRSNRWHINLVIFFSLFIFFATLKMFILGQLGLLRPSTILIASLVMIALLFAGSSSRSILREAPGSTRNLQSALSAWWRKLPSPLKVFTVLFVSISILRFAVLIVVLPPYVWDSLSYHLTNVAEWVQRGRIELFETSITRIYTPANYETFALWFTTFLHHDALVEAAGLPAYLLALAAVYSVCRSINISPSVAWLSSLAYISTPAVIIATTGTKNDPHMAAYYLAMLAIIMHLANTDESNESVNVLGVTISFIVILFLAFGTKAYLIHILPGLALVALLVRSKKGVLEWFQWIWSEVINDWVDRKSWIRIVLICVLICAVGLGLYWNLRNWILTGNPFYPYGVQVEGGTVFDEGDKDMYLNLYRLEMNLKSLAWKFGDRQYRIGTDLTDSTGWGWFAYIVGIPTLIVSFFMRRDLRILSAGLLLSLLLIFFSIRPSPWNMRYLLWFPAIFSFGFAVWMDQLKPLSRWPGLVIPVVAAFLMLVNTGIVWNYGNIPADKITKMLSLSIYDRDSAKLAISMPREYENALEIVPENATLGYNVIGNGFVYPLYRADYSQKLVYIPISLDGTCEDIAEAMSSRGTRYLFVAPEHTDDEVLGFLHQCGNAEEYLRERSFNLYVIPR